MQVPVGTHIIVDFFTLILYHQNISLVSYSNFLETVHIHILPKESDTYSPFQKNQITQLQK